MDRVFFALSDATRRDMVARVAVRKMSVAQLASSYPISMPAVLKHIGVLESAGIIETQKKGRTRTCRIQRESLDDAAVWLEKYATHWEAELAKLEALFDNLGNAK